MTTSEPGWIGRKLGERYEIEELIGRGGMSSVYRAVDPHLKRNVAVKIIHLHLTDNSEFIQRFEQEAAAVAQLRHNHIVQVYDFNSDSGVYYMVMEFIAGETLAQKLKALNIAKLHLPIADTINILTKVCEAVNFAHEQGMIHRDIKPANVMINLLGEPFLMDFGIAKIVGGQSHTATGAAMGTAPYMSPEQVRGDKTDHRTDIYSLGIMLYEMLSGSPPFHGESTFQIMLRHVNEPIPDIRQFELNVPVALIAILEKALSKEPHDRFQSARELGNALTLVSLQLHGSVNDTLAARYLDRLALLWQQATDLYENNRFEGCIDKLDELKQVDPHFQRDKIQALRQNAVDGLYEQAVLHYQKGSYQVGQQYLKALKLRSPDEPEIEQLAEKIQEGLKNQHLITKLESLYEEAAVLLDGKAYDQALARWQAVQHQRGHIPFSDSLNIAQRAQKGLCDSKYKLAAAALSNGQPEQTFEIWNEIVAMQPDYPDPQALVGQAAAMLKEKRQRSRILMGAAGGIILLLLLFWGMQTLNSSSGRSAGSPTAAAVGDNPTGLPAAISPVIPTNTAVSTPTPFPTPAPIPTRIPAVVPSATPFSTSSPVAPTEIMVTATANDNAALFTEPDVDSNILDFISVKETVTVNGRTENESWLFVTTSEDVKGYVAANLFDLESETISALVVITPIVMPGGTPAGPNSGSGGILTLATYPVGGTCSTESWTAEIFAEAQGGDGRYSYYNGPTLLEANISGFITFTVPGIGNNVTIEVRVTAGDGQTVTETLFVRRAEICN